MFENKFFCYIPRNRIITNTFKIKATSRHGSVLSTFSLAPFLALNPVTEIDELKNENYSNKFISELMNNSTKLPSEPFSQLSLISKDQEKGNIK